jgi:hypothetical protein
MTLPGINLVLCCLCGQEVSDFEETGRTDDEYICTACAATEQGKAIIEEWERRTLRDT